jgi:hypothetical protein
MSSSHCSYHCSGILGWCNNRLCSIAQAPKMLITFLTSRGFLIQTFNPQRQGNRFFINPMQCSDLIRALESLLLKNSFSALRQDWPPVFLYALTILAEGLNAESPIMYLYRLKKNPPPDHSGSSVKSFYVPSIIPIQFGNPYGIKKRQDLLFFSSLDGQLTTSSRKDNTAI